MKVTKRGEYALRALLALAFVHEQRTLNLREIAEQEKLPLKFLEQIMIVLKRNNFVESTKGKHGGYALSRLPEEITLGEIIRAVDGPLAPLGTRREIEKKVRRNDRESGLYAVLLDVRNAISEILDKKTLADVCEKSLQLARTGPGLQMYYI